MHVHLHSLQVKFIYVSVLGSDIKYGGDYYCVVLLCGQFATVSIPVSETFAAKFMEQIEVCQWIETSLSVFK